MVRTPEHPTGTNPEKPPADSGPAQRRGAGGTFPYIPDLADSTPDRNTQGDRTALAGGSRFLAHTSKLWVSGWRRNPIPSRTNQRQMQVSC